MPRRRKGKASNPGSVNNVQSNYTSGSLEGRRNWPVREENMMGIPTIETAKNPKSSTRRRTS
jgi:hypothetical protein